MGKVLREGCSLDISWHFCQFFSLKRSHRSGMLSITRENHPMEALGVVQYISIPFNRKLASWATCLLRCIYLSLYTSFSLTKVISWNQRNDPKRSNPLSQVTTFVPKHKNKHTQKKIKARYLLGVGLRSSVSIFCWPTIRVTPTALQSLQPTPLRWRARSGAKPNVPQGEFFGGWGPMFGPQHNSPIPKNWYIKKWSNPLTWIFLVLRAT